MEGPNTKASDDLDALPIPATTEARAQGCTCPDPQPGQGTPGQEGSIVVQRVKEGKGEVS